MIFSIIWMLFWVFLAVFCSVCFDIVNGLLMLTATKFTNFTSEQVYFQLSIQDFLISEKVDQFHQETFTFLLAQCMYP